MFNVVLYSKDETLVSFCREVLSEILDSQYTLKNWLPGHALPPYDLCIWDFTPGETVFPDDLEPAMLRSHWFMLERNDVSALQAQLGTPDLKLLLKPVTRSALRAFVAGVQSRRHCHDGDSDAEIDVLRSERDSMLQFLIQANLKLQEYDQERSNLLARSVHDFRSPLTAISGYCGLLLGSELGPLTPEQREILGRMQQSATRVSRITSAMFQMSVPQNIEQRSKLQRGDIRDCVEQALQEVALFVDAKGIAVTVEIEPQPEGLFFEKPQIEQALANILANACRFTPRNGTVEIRGYPSFWERRTGRSRSFGSEDDRRMRESRAANSFRIDIRDSGPGIPPAHLHRIFEEYTTYYGRQDRSGGGLGLAICRMIIHRHRGRIWAESSASGAVFSFLLPVQAPERIGSQNCSNRELVGRVLDN